MRKSDVLQLSQRYPELQAGLNLFAQLRESEEVPRRLCLGWAVQTKR